MQVFHRFSFSFVFLAISPSAPVVSSVLFCFIRPLSFLPTFRPPNRTSFFSIMMSLLCGVCLDVSSFTFPLFSLFCERCRIVLQIRFFSPSLLRLFKTIRPGAFLPLSAGSLFSFCTLSLGRPLYLCKTVYVISPLFFLPVQPDLSKPLFFFLFIYCLYCPFGLMPF